MFFKQTVLKRMLKAAYKGAGLTVGHDAGNEEGGSRKGIIFLPGGGSSGFWLTQCQRKQKRPLLNCAEIFRDRAKCLKQ